MEFKKKINILIIVSIGFIHKVLFSVNRHEWLKKVREFFKLKEKNGEVRSFEIYKNTNNITTEIGIFHYMISYYYKNIKVLSGGAGEDEADAITHAFGEAVERYLYFKQIETGVLDIPNTNGAAVHNNLYDCIKNSFLEMCERHYMLIHWYGKKAASKRVCVENHSFLHKFDNMYKNKNVNLSFLLLNKSYGVYTVCIISRTDAKQMGFNILSSFASDFSLENAFVRAAKELIRSMANKPLDKITKRYDSAKDVEDLMDHQYYFQVKGRRQLYDFLESNDLDVISLSTQKRTIFFEFMLLLNAIIRFDCKLFWIRDKKSFGIPVFFTKLFSSRMLEICFGNSHNKININLLKKNVGEVYDLSEPHPMH